MLPSPDYRYSVVIEANHPTTDGHFVGKPLVPGVVILEHVRVALSEWDARMKLSRFARVKFSTPLLPDNQLQISLSKKNDSQYRFVCVDANESTIASGDFFAMPK